MGTLSSDYPNAAAVEAALDRANRAEIDIIDIKQRLDALEYQDIKINSFSAVPSVCELGSSNTVNLNWVLNKAATSQYVNGVLVTGSTKEFINVSSNTTYTLNVTDSKTMASKSVDVTFANQVYYGVSENLNNVTSLTKVLSNSKTRTFTVNAGSDKYIIYAIPKRLGNVTFYVNGFEGGFDAPVEQSITNASGYQETYKVYKSTNPNLGETTVEVKGG